MSLSENEGSMVDCIFCSGGLKPQDVVAEWPDWRVVMNHNQNYLGKLMLVLRRHETDATALSASEQQEFWNVLEIARKSLDRLFQPDHYNYSFLMNLNRHVHLHVIPRYADQRRFSGKEFTDGEIGDHYGFENRRVEPEFREKLADALRSAGLTSDADRGEGT